VSLEAVETPQETPTLSHEESVEAIVVGMKDGTIDRDRITAEIYMFMHEMKSVMSMISNGKMSGILGKLLGGK
jgi:hypothetical protein